MKSTASSSQNESTQHLLLERLVDELIKSNPNQELLRTQMTAAGLKYSSDPVMSMSVVLQALEDSRFISTDFLEIPESDSGVSQMPTRSPKNTSDNTKRNSTASKRRERDNVQDL